MPKLKPLAQPGLPPAAYTDPAILELERNTLFRTCWQWAGLIDDLQRPGGLTTEIAGLPIIVTGYPQNLRVNTQVKCQLEPLDYAVADVCGRFVFVRLSNDGPVLEDYLGDYAALLKQCTQDFDEVYHVAQEKWACNWKAGLEITLEGYHVYMVHDGSKFVDAVPESAQPIYAGAHSYHCGLIGDRMRNEMANIAKRLKIIQNTQYANYDHFTIFPNMTVGISGGCLCFMQIYTPLSANRTSLRYAYIMSRLIDPEQQPVPLIKTTLLNKWRNYTVMVLGEDRVACERFQQGVGHATKPALIGRKAEERVAHFHKYWRMATAVEDSHAH